MLDEPPPGQPGGELFQRKRRGDLKGGTGRPGPGGLFGDPGDSGKPSDRNANVYGGPGVPVSVFSRTSKLTTEN